MRPLALQELTPLSMRPLAVRTLLQVGHIPPTKSGCRIVGIRTGLVSTFTRQPDDPFVEVLADVDEGLVELQMHPGQDLDEAVHLRVIVH